MRYKIRNRSDKSEYWSNADGWTDFETADSFTDVERQTLNLPVDGEWITVETLEPSKPRFRFALGQIVATPGAVELLERTHTNPVRLLQRHLSGDWGELCPEDVQENEESLEHGYRLMSNYPIESERLWIITEADRSVTTLLLPEEY